jgi:undecaprenyl-diphosphatase
MISADESVFFWINGLAGKVTVIDDIIRTLSCDLFIPVVMILAMVGLWFVGHNQEQRERHQRAVFCSLAGMGFANLVVYILNAALPDRLRPFAALEGVKLLFYPPTDPSFPSNAAAAAFAMAIGVWLYNRKLGYILLVPAVIIAFGRVYMGVHYPLDIVGGFLAAIVGVAIARLVLRLAEPVPTKIIMLMRKIYLA